MEHPSFSAGSGVEASSRTIKIDSEHFAIRFLLPVFTIILLVVVHIGGTAVLESALDGADALCFILPVDLAVLVFGSMLIERLLKLALPSRRFAIMDLQGLEVTDGRKNPPVVVRVDWHKSVNVRAWRFTIARRGRRVPRGWYCMALQLLQDETDPILYTFMSPQEAEGVPGFNKFVRLRPRNETQSNTDLNAIAEQRRLLKLEDARWEDGAEIMREDFAAILAQLQRVFPDWR